MWTTATLGVEEWSYFYTPTHISATSRSTVTWSVESRVLCIGCMWLGGGRGGHTGHTALMACICSNVQQFVGTSACVFVVCVFFWGGGGAKAKWTPLSSSSACLRTAFTIRSVCLCVGGWLAGWGTRIHVHTHIHIHNRTLAQWACQSFQLVDPHTPIHYALWSTSAALTATRRNKMARLRTGPQQRTWLPASAVACRPTGIRQQPTAAGGSPTAVGWFTAALLSLMECVYGGGMAPARTVVWRRLVAYRHFPLSFLEPSRSVGGGAHGPLIPLCLEPYPSLPPCTPFLSLGRLCQRGEGGDPAC